MSFINALSSRSQAPPSPSTPCVLQPTNIPDNSPFDMDASYWPPFQPSASSSSTPSPVSPADLPSLIARPVSSELVNYLVDRVQDAVDFGLDRSPQPAASAYAHNKARNHSRAWRSRAELDAAERERRAVLDFTTNLLRRAEVSFSIVLGALVYIERAKPHLSIAIEEWAHHRVLMGSLIAAAKYLNDASLKNAHWALCSGVFGRRDVQRIEREFLDVLDFELSVKEHDLIRVCNCLADAGVLGFTKPKPKPTMPVIKVKSERERKDSGLGLEAVRRLWDEKRRQLAREQQAQGRPEKRQKSISMDIDVEEERGRFKERRTDAHTLPPPPPQSQSVTVPRLIVSPASSCSACSSSSNSPASSISPQTPPQPPASAPPMAYNFPHYALPNTSPNKSGSYPLLLSFPSFPPIPTPPTHASLPPAPLPQPLPGRLPFYKVSGPKPAIPLDFDMDTDMENGEFSFESPTTLVPTYRPRSRTPSKLRMTSSMPSQAHKRSSALSMYPSFVAPVNA